MNAKIALTLYTLRDFCTSEDSLLRTLERVRKIGYEYVQVSGVPLEAEIIRKALDRQGLICCATHQSLADLEDIEALARRLDILGCDFAAIGYPGIEYFTDSGINRVAGFMNSKGRELGSKGIRLGYHNHHFEFKKADDGTCLLEKFYRETSPEYVFAELDTHWVARGGGSPEAWIRKVSGRMPVVHFKDLALTEEAEPVFCEVGEGNLDWCGIIEACRQTGVEYYVVEQDLPCFDRDIFDSAAISYKNLKGLLK